MRKSFGFVVASGAAFMLAGQTFAAPMTAGLQPKYTTTAPQPSNITSAGGFYDGVGDFIINNSNRCSGGLLSDGLHVLTAAHCVTDDFGNDTFNSGNITFHGDFSTYTIAVDEVFIHQDWTGNLGAGDDIAVVRLASVVDSEITRYDIYRDADEVGQVGDKVGFGKSGDGTTGDNLSSGTKRNVQNRYDVAGLPFFGGISSDVLLYDFDNGDPLRDGLGALAGSYTFNSLPVPPFLIDPIGVGLNEGMSAPGDSGGPTFLNNMIAGVTSFGFTYCFINEFGSCASSPDLDGLVNFEEPNSTFGEIAGDTRVSSYASFVDGFLVSVPVPLSSVLLVTGLLGFARLRQLRA